jgi:hypothetical protein
MLLYVQKSAVKIARYISLFIYSFIYSFIESGFVHLATVPMFHSIIASNDT